LNYRLGGGSFASQLTQQLREGKAIPMALALRLVVLEIGPFTIASGVRSNVTFESVNLIKDILMQYKISTIPIWK
jgi:zinc protease